jgi:gliding motility-associated-like protein
MKIAKILLFILVSAIISPKIIAQNIIVNDTYTAQQLVETLTNNSPCATASNFSVSGGNFGTGEQSYGYFDATGTLFSLQSGIVLSTGKAINTQGPNSTLSDDGIGIGWNGDTDLQQALGLSNSFNATVLEFDFTPLTNYISFDYIFSSEQYLSNPSANQCNFTDGFAFLLKENGTTNYTNLAVVPGTSTPVKVNTVRGTGTICPAANEYYFDAFNGVNYPTNFNGQTKVMKAEANVTAGLSYHIKIVIADEGNERYDSAIFLGAGSFNVGVDLGLDQLVATNNPICENDIYTLNATIAGVNTYKWYKNGILIPGEINPTYDVHDAGVYKVEVTIAGTTCVAIGEVAIEYSPLPTLFNQTLVQCDTDNDGITTFNLTQLNQLITGNSATLGNPAYYESLADAQMSLNPIPNPSAYLNTTTNQVFASVGNAFRCTSYATVDLVISNNTIAQQSPFLYCDEDGTIDGFTAIDLNQDITPSILTGLPSGLTVAYYSSENDAILENNPLPNPFTNTTAFQQTIYARVLNGPDCYGITPIILNVPVFNPPNLQDETLYICPNSNLILDAGTGFVNYNWTTTETTQQITINQQGNYKVTVTNVDGCEKTKTFFVLDSNIPIINSVNVTDFSGTNNTLEITTAASGNFEYSLDGINYQDNSIFTNVYPNEYVVYVRDKNGCGIATQTVLVLDFPRFFTPNNDGINDTWFIKNIPNSKITIYDRFGKIITQFKGELESWNGKLNGNDSLSDDYWFVIEFENGKKIKEHFSLKR